MTTENAALSWDTIAAIRKWLDKIAENQPDPRRYMRWLETPEGDCSDSDDYCPECARIQRYVNRHKKSPYTRVSGWDETFEEDGPRYCARCNCMLFVSLTDYGVERELEYLADEEELLPADAMILRELMWHGPDWELMPQVVSACEKLGFRVEDVR